MTDTCGHPNHGAADHDCAPFKPESAQPCTCTDPAAACPSCLALRDRNGWPKDWQERMRDGWHDLLRPGDDCGGAPDWCLAPNGVECGQHDENGDRRD